MEVHSRALPSYPWWHCALVLTPAGLGTELPYPQNLAFEHWVHLRPNVIRLQVFAVAGKKLARLTTLVSHRRPTCDMSYQKSTSPRSRPLRFGWIGSYPKLTDTHSHSLRTSHKIGTDSPFADSSA
jgi:hypothetical protein